MNMYALHLGQVISTVLGQVDHAGQHGNAARTPVQGESGETGHLKKQHLVRSAIPTKI